MKKKTVLSRVVLSLFLAFAFNITAYAGVALPSSIGDFVWEDLNGDGVQDGGELGLGFINVQLCGGTATTIDCAALSLIDTTDANGKYLFEADDYSNYFGTHLVAMVNLVSVPPSSLIATTPTKIFIEITGNSAPILDADFGFQAVPVPAAAWLFGSGLLGLISMARRKRAV